MKNSLRLFLMKTEVSFFEAILWLFCFLGTIVDYKDPRVRDLGPIADESAILGVISLIPLQI